MMNFYINSPSYYTQKNGVIDEIYQMCKGLSTTIDVTHYTSVLDTIGITPIIVPASFVEENQYTEVKHISLRYRMASLSLISSNYETFEKATIEEKKMIILENILESLLVIKQKLKGKFDYNAIKSDILRITTEINYQPSSVNTGDDSLH